MTPTDRVSRIIQIACKVIEALRLNQAHSLAIKSLNRLVNNRLIIELVREIESRAPVAEVARNDEDSLLIQEER